MKSLSRTGVLVAAVLASACGPTKEAAKAADTTAAVAPTPPPPPQAIVTVLYKWPKDTAKFEKYYPTHLKIVGDHQQEIGFTRAELTKFVSSLQGTKSEYYRQAELYFPSMDAAKAGIATAGFKAVGDDFKNFVAPDGLIALIAEETGTPSDTPCPALATVIYGTPASAEAFEAYYPKHLALVTADNHRFRARRPYQVRLEPRRHAAHRVSPGGTLLQLDAGTRDRRGQCGLRTGRQRLRQLRVRRDPRHDRSPAVVAHRHAGIEVRLAYR